MHVLAAFRLVGRAPTDGEARLAAAVFAARDGRVGAVDLPVSDLLAAHQLAAVTALLPDPGSVWDGVRVAALVLGAATAVLLWRVLRRLGCGTVSTALAVGIVGVLPVALGWYTSLTAAVAVPWLLLAVLSCWRGRALGIVAGVAAAIAVLTAPLLGAVVLAVGAHEAGRGGSGGSRRLLAVGLGAAAVAVGVAAADGGPLAGRAAPVVPTGAAVLGSLCGLAVVVAGWRVRWVRPLLGPAFLVLAVLLVPGPGRAAAALTALPLLAVIAAAVVDDVAVRVATRVRPRVLSGLRVAVAVVGTVTAMMVTAVAAVAAPGEAPLGSAAVSGDPLAGPLLAWVGDAAAPGATVHADALDRAELVAAGFPPERLRDVGGPVADGDVVLHTGRADAGSPAPAACATGILLATVPRPIGTTEICGAGPVVDTEPQALPSRVRIGTALAGNPSLQLDPAAAELLRSGAVDPRLMIVLAALAGGHTLSVADFPPSPLEPPATVRRHVLVTAVDGTEIESQAASLRDWLRGQHPPYSPTVVRDDRSGLLVGYRTPAPVGLLPG